MKGFLPSAVWIIPSGRTTDGATGVRPPTISGCETRPRHELDKDAPSGVMHLFGHVSPASFVCVGVKTGLVNICAANRGRKGLRDDQTGARALGRELGHQREGVPSAYARMRDIGATKFDSGAASRLSAQG